ncbi:uncharacterized protein LOC110268917 [Arachis ipaensis]|uniref:uncharacterized protein LOC110268917 n=1 Tax=Arachis ipaensis TaxID=130454 RepID=UPI000A2B4242|nr:uncharacterized protein LOC110268917 [Arachis ipaensis]
MTANEYLKKIRDIVDSMASIGYTLFLEDHISAITDGLNEDYALYLSIVMEKSESITLIEAEALLLGHEKMIERFEKIALGTIQEHYTQSSSSLPRPPNTTNYVPRRGREGKSSNRVRFTNSDSRPICQVCGRTGHTALLCFHRFNQQYQASSSNAKIPTQSKLLPPPTTYHNPRAYMAAPSTFSDASWLPDTGTSNHVTNDAQSILAPSEFLGKDQLLLGNGSGHPGDSSTRSSI